MVESILDLCGLMNEALKPIGKCDMCLDADDFSVLEELGLFLGNFKSMTLLVSACNPNLSLLPLLQTRIHKACEPQLDDHQRAVDSASIKCLKYLVKSSLDKRIKINNLVKIACCFDPAVRDVVLSKCECQELLLNVHRMLTDEGSDTDHLASPVRHLLVNNHDNLSVSQPTKTAPDTDDHGTEVKKLRLSLLQVMLYDARVREHLNYTNLFIHR